MWQEYLNIKNIDYLYLSIVYLICFIFMCSKKTEYFCFILLYILNFYFLITFLSNDKSETMKKLIFIIGWILLFVANTILIRTYILLHGVYGSRQIDFGDIKNLEIKNNLKLTLIFGTISLWILYFFDFKSAFALPVIILSSVSVYLSQRLSRKTRIISTPNNRG
jgi:hypothetical protein